MASAIYSEYSANVFEESEFFINRQFDLILESVNKRRGKLLKELSQLKSKWQSETEKHFQAIQKLESMRKGIESLCIKDNQFSHVHNASLNPVVQELNNLKSKIKYPNIYIRNCDVQTIISLANDLGELQIDVPADDTVLPTLPKHVEMKRKNSITSADAALNEYQTKPSPILRIQNKGTQPGQFTNAKSIFFCETNNRLFIVSDFEHKVLTFSIDGKFISEFGGNILKRPCGIFANYDYTFVTDESLLGIFSFSSGGFLARQLIHSFAARGIVGDNCEQKLYVTDPIANCICVFNFSLVRMKTIHFQRSINLSVEIQLFKDVLYLISSGKNTKCFVSYNTDGVGLRSLIPRAYLQDNNPPVHFCIDSFGNFILTEYMDSQLKVFSAGGEFSCTIGKQKEGIPKAVCVANDRVVCALQDGIICVY